MMKLLIASDIHGSAYYCEKLLRCFESEKADKLLLLGDILYHGPRNDLPKGHDPKKVIQLLNGYKNIIFNVRGNCDTEVDQMVLDFPVLAEYSLLTDGVVDIYATHGHKYNIDVIPPLSKGTILAYGHTHIPNCGEKDGIICINPGSVSIPKEDSWHGYILYENGFFVWKDFDGNIKMEYSIDRKGE